MTAKIGRPTILTPERAEVVLAVLEGGGTVTDAARAVGLPYQTLRYWAFGSRDTREPSFRRAVREADARHDARRLSRKYGVDAADVVRVLTGDLPDVTT